MITHDDGFVARILETRLDGVEARLHAIESGQWTRHEDNVGTLPVDLNEHTLALRIPPDANQVLIFVSKYAGFTADCSGVYRIWTQTADGRAFEHQLYLHQYEQGAVPFNSCTFWLPITDERLLHVRFHGAGTPSATNQGSQIRVLGYKTMRVRVQADQQLVRVHGAVVADLERENAHLRAQLQTLERNDTANRARIERLEELIKGL